MMIEGGSESGRGIMNLKSDDESVAHEISVDVVVFAELIEAARLFS
jgi:hypothetical protein